METHVEYPTDTRLLFEAIRKAIELLLHLCGTLGLIDWQEGQEKIGRFKKLLRKVQRLKHASAHDEAKKEARQKAIIEAHQEYLRVARDLLQQAEKTVQEISKKHPGSRAKLLKIEEFIDHAQRQIKQVERRVSQGESIPHQEKVLSIFAPYTDWLSKGKAGVPVE